MDIELFDLIFEARKNDDVIYNEKGEVKYIMNTDKIFNEFLIAEDIIHMLSYLIDDNDTLYQSMIDSYRNQPNIKIFESLDRRNYVFGMTYTKLFEQEQKIITSEEDLGDLINDRWKNYKAYVEEYIIDKDFIDDASFLGILDQTYSEYPMQKGNTKK